MLYCLTLFNDFPFQHDPVSWNSTSDTSNWKHLYLCITRNTTYSNSLNFILYVTLTCDDNSALLSTERRDKLRGARCFFQMLQIVIVIIKKDSIFPLQEETRSRFTEYSMTSSVMRRNEQLTLLDDRFEKVRQLKNVTLTQKGAKCFFLCPLVHLLRCCPVCLCKFFLPLVVRAPNGCCLHAHSI